MSPTSAGVIAAAAVIAAFVAGSMIEFEDGALAFEAPAASDGPMEQIGEALDEAANN